MIKFGFLLALLSFYHSALALDNPPSFFSIQYENDLFVPSNQDRYYTSGLQLTLLKKQQAPAILKSISKLTPFYEQGKDLSLVQYTFGQKMFTPDDIETPLLQVKDRPYAGYLFFGAAVMSHIKKEDNIDYGNQFEVTIGIVGPAALGEQAQTTIHKQIGSPIPQGWDNQLKNEITLGLNYSRFRRIIKPLPSFGLELGMNNQISGSIGNAYTYGATGIMFRLGNNLAQDLSPPNIRPGFPGLSFFKPQKKATWYVYMGLEARAILRNIFLDGNTFTQSHSVNKEPLIADLQYGLVYMLGNIRFSISNMFRSKEFTEQLGESNFGLLNATIKF